MEWSNHIVAVPVVVRRIECVRGGGTPLVAVAGGTLLVVAAAAAVDCDGDMPLDHVDNIPDGSVRAAQSRNAFDGLRRPSVLPGRLLLRTRPASSRCDGSAREWESWDSRTPHVQHFAVDSPRMIRVGRFPERLERECFAGGGSGVAPAAAAVDGDMPVLVPPGRRQEWRIGRASAEPGDDGLLGGGCGAGGSVVALERDSVAVVVAGGRPIVVLRPPLVPAIRV